MNSLQAWAFDSVNSCFVYIHIRDWYKLTNNYMSVIWFKATRGINKPALEDNIKYSVIVRIPISHYSHEILGIFTL
jgi:hypothetical protein